MSGINHKNAISGLKATLDPIGSIKKNGLKDTLSHQLDPGDLAGQRQKAIDAKAEAADTAKNQALTDADLAALRARMLPNSPLNTFRPFVDPSTMPQRTPPQMPGAGQQFSPDMLRQMMQSPQYGQMAGQQWMQQRQATQPQKLVGIPRGLLQG